MDQLLTMHPIGKASTGREDLDLVQEMILNMSSVEREDFPIIRRHRDNLYSSCRGGSVQDWTHFDLVPFRNPQDVRIVSGDPYFPFGHEGEIMIHASVDALELLAPFQFLPLILSCPFEAEDLRAGKLWLLSAEAAGQQGSAREVDPAMALVGEAAGKQRHDVK